MANAASEGSGVRNPRTGTNTRAPRRYAALSQWTNDNSAAAHVLANPTFGGIGARVVQPGTPSEKKPPDWYTGFTTESYQEAVKKTGSTNPLVQAIELGPNDPEERVAMEQASLEDKNRKNRLTAINEKHYRPVAERMTWAEYNKLTPQQRAAVDFNTLLTRAVRKDQRLQGKYNPEGVTQDTYDLSLEKMFGSDERGSDTYAPETLGLLKQIGYKDVNADLDDFLKLKTVITEKDLEDLPTVKGVPQAVAYSGQAPERTEELGVQRQLAASTLDIEKQLAKGNQIMQSMIATAEVARRSDVSRIGGLSTEINTSLGYGPAKWQTNDATGQRLPADTNTFFQDSYDKLAETTLTNVATGEKTDTATLIPQLRAAMNDKEWNDFLNYADSRSNTALQYGAPLGEPTKGVTYRTPEQFRQMLKLRGGTY